MMSLETIRDLSREAGQRAAEMNREPYMLWQEELDDWRAGRFKSFPFPNLGDYRPEGWELIDKLFVDKAGMGNEREPALTLNGFLNELEADYGYGIVEEGQFQLYVGKFKRLNS